MAVLLVVCAGMLAARSAWLSTHSASRLPSPIVEVRGSVPAPGFHPAETIHEALTAAGAATAGQVDARLQEGTRLVVSESGSVSLEPMDALMVFGLPISINEASPEALMSIPGIGEARARAIIAEREQGGAFQTLEDLQRVKGVGPSTIETLRPFIVVKPCS